MSEKSEAVKGCIVHVLSDNGEAGLELLQEQWLDEQADHIYDLLDVLPEMLAIDHLCGIVSGDRAKERDGKTDLAETRNIAELLISQSERLNEIGQENDHEGLLFAGGVIRDMGKQIHASIQHHGGLSTHGKDGVG